MEMVVRVFIEVAHREQALSIASHLARLLAAQAVLRSSRVDQYWKIPEYFEVLLVLEAERGSTDTLDLATAALGTGWLSQGAREAIWNYGEGHTFRVEEARWAHIELLGT